MKFFKPSDFALYYEEVHQICPETAKIICDAANAKLERHENVVYGANVAGMYGPFKTDNSKFKALLINIEPIEKCTHPSEKVRVIALPRGKDVTKISCLHQCECGARVTPASFEVVE